MGGPAIVHIKEDLTCLVAVINNAPFDIQLERNNFIGAVETLEIGTVQPIETLQVVTINRPGPNHMVETQKLKGSILAQTPSDRQDEFLSLLH